MNKIRLEPMVKTRKSYSLPLLAAVTVVLGATFFTSVAVMVWRIGEYSHYVRTAGVPQ